MDHLGSIENLSSVQRESDSRQAWPFVIRGHRKHEWLPRSSGVITVVLKTEVPVLNSFNLTQNHNYNLSQDTST